MSGSWQLTLTIILHVIFKPVVSVGHVRQLAVDTVTIIFQPTVYVGHVRQLAVTTVIITCIFI
jgi:hypothetical protein